jgi:hypothetical protein
VKNARPPDRPPDSAAPDAEADAVADARLTRALRDLPHADASPTFTDGVLSRATAGTVPSARRWRLAYPALLAGAAALGASLLLLRPSVRPLAPPSAAPTEAVVRAELEQLRQLRREQRDLAAEVENLRAHPREAFLPVVYLGRSGDIDLVLDLAQFQHGLRTGEEGEPR